ncbi:peptidase YpeB-like protein [Streptomyces sp. Amel2xB2]|uniref:PepSY domain-containing protein n=1 Tax=Streptomyces sp. Amel2xB2 TaxID=1305829 RepID=UPI000DBAD22A|nr:PepSY domain-containing protein [Streptomyces sp. Amel2xB2]RAJ71305.1 peptidase YpeB-like protein [Streptomyces sp. Amel2xB2]
MQHRKSHARKRTVLAVIAAGGIALGGGTLAVAGQSSAGAPGAGDQANVREASGVTMAQATDRVLQQATNGRVTKAVATRENGRSVFKVDFVQGSRTLQSTVDATTGEILRTGARPAASGASSDSARTAPESCTGDFDDDDDADDDGDDDSDDAGDDDDDDGPIRGGVTPSK